MPLSSTSATQLSFIEESQFGVTPAAGTPRKLRMTGESLAYNVQSETSKEIDDTRQNPDQVHVGAAVEGGVNIEASFREYDTFLEALLSNTFSTAFGTDGVESLTVSFDAAANTITDDGVDGFAGLVAGQWFSVIGAGNNTGIYRIATFTSDALTLDPATPLAETSAAVSCQISSSRLVNGTAALRTFSLQKFFSDVTQYFMFRGCAVSKLDLSFEAAQLVTGTFNLMGSGSERSATTLMPAAPDPSFSHGVMNAVTGVGNILLDGGTTLLGGAYIKSMKLSVDQALRGQTGIGNLGYVGIGLGRYKINGSMEVYLADGSIYDKAIANTAVSIQFRMADVNKNGYAFTMNNCKLSVPGVTAGSMDSDVLLNFNFEAVAPNTSSDKMLIVDRFGVAAA